ncbi:LacI family DNA-binding transcriptional regulator [bacterium]|nr:LacI family DNA-binding transcriptional regulator [bacterium]
MTVHVTLKDLAKRLKVSPSTVSRALNDHPDISSPTKKRILALAESLDYHPDNVAQSLKNACTKTIGVIIPEIKHDFFASVLDGIEDITHEAGYTILLCKSNESYEREVINTKVLASHRIAGLIVSIAQDTKDSLHFQSLQRRRIPLVFFDRVFEDFPSSKVIVNDEEGAFSAVNYLIKSGYKRIAHIGGPQHLSIAKKRFQGYCRALEENNIPVNMDYVLFGGMYEEDGGVAFDRLHQFKPDAVFAVNDPVAVGAIVKIKAVGLSIPKDVAVVGFSDNAIASIIDPPLTTIAQPAYEMGASAARLLMDEIQQKNSQRKAVVETLKTRLIIRKTT